jgi:hypothetical protein
MSHANTDSFMIKKYDAIFILLLVYLKTFNHLFVIQGTVT